MRGESVFTSDRCFLKAWKERGSNISVRTSTNVLRVNVCGTSLAGPFVLDRRYKTIRREFGITTITSSCNFLRQGYYGKHLTSKICRS